jgi:hypothetical protein
MDKAGWERGNVKKIIGRNLKKMDKKRTKMNKKWQNATPVKNPYSEFERFVSN